MMKQHMVLYWASLKSLIIDTPGRACAVCGVACLVSGCRFWLEHRDSSVFSWEKPEDVKMPDLTDVLIQEQKGILRSIDAERKLHWSLIEELRRKIDVLEKEKDEQRDASGVGHAGLGTQTAA